MMITAASDAVTAVTSAINWVTVERATVIGILMFIVWLMATGRVVTRKTADTEQKALKDGYEAKDEAHAETVSVLRERVATLEEIDREKSELLKKKEELVELVLNEMAPSLVAWSEARRKVMGETGDVNDGDMGT